MTELLLLLADGRFPSGGHAHSGGLEAAVGAGDVCDLPTLGAFLEGRVTTAGAVDAWAAAAACAGADPALVETEYEARCPSPALRAAGRAQGRGLKRTAAQSWPAVASSRVEQHAVVLGCVARAAGVAPADAAALAIHSLLMGAAAAAVRLLPLDMADTAAVVARLAPVAERVARESVTQSEGPAWSGPANELRAEEHARWEVRLFAS